VRAVEVRPVIAAESLARQMWSAPVASA
jgi:hypothetical protein